MTTQDNQNQNEQPEPEKPSGFTDLTGPAAFKAQMKQQTAAEEQAAEALELGAPHNDEQIVQLEKALAEAKDQLIRTVADMENLRKRAAREREDASKFAVSGFARDLLDVADTFRRALVSIPEELRTDDKILPLIQGIEATERVFLSCFEKNGIKKIEPLDEIFNPNFHEVMFEAPIPDKQNGTIIQIIEPGYMLHDRLLRPARVGVAKTVGASDAHNVDTQA
ncbi:MAG TPA: nucleotide exchange factor GrpE [Alphaproteobacteria bacterium]|nr:nucleotide exchange factor GrpE [Alphaproteobacteria bacterium]HNS44758.1 nucleotide exchange factor GrpE [Alphaproteobacteria bacterium]